MKNLFNLCRATWHGTGGLLFLLAGPPMAFGQSLTSFAPAAGAPGAVITLTGINLTGTRDVSFGGVASLSFTVASATTITAVVPQQAATGKITVTTPTATRQSVANFTVLVPASPLLTGPVSGVSLRYSNSPFTLLNNHFFFSTTQGGSTQLWRSDGTAAGTISVSSSIHPPVNAEYALASERYLYFFERTTGNGKLVAMDGNLVKRDLSTPLSRNDTYALLNQKAIYDRDRRIWVFNEASGTSQQLLDFDPHLVVAHRGLAYFKGNPGSGGYGIGRTDGTVAGTFLFNIPGSPYAYSFGGAGDYMYISVSTTGSLTTTLYRTNGDANTPLTPITGFQGEIRHLTDVNGTLFFMGRASSGTTGWELYKVANTAAVMVTDLAPGPADGVRYSVKPVAIGNALYFQGENNQGIELWKSDGTAGGTVQASNQTTGSGNTYADYLTPVGNRLYFSGGEYYTDGKLHVTDGTVAGTRPLSYPSEDIFYLSYFRGKLVFSATTVNISRLELHLYNLAGQATPTATPLPAGRFEVYPNPATDFVTIRPAAAQVRWAVTLCNALGQKIEERNGEANTSMKIDMRQFPAGIYHLLVEDGREHYTTKLSKP